MDTAAGQSGRNNLTADQRQRLALVFWREAPCPMCVTIEPHDPADLRSWCRWALIQSVMGEIPTWAAEEPNATGPLPTPPITESQFMPVPNGRTFYNELVADLFDRIPQDVIESHGAQEVLQYFSAAIERRFRTNTPNKAKEQE